MGTAAGDLRPWWALGKTRAAVNGAGNRPVSRSDRPGHRPDTEISHIGPARVVVASVCVVGIAARCMQPSAGGVRQVAAGSAAMSVGSGV